MKIIAFIEPQQTHVIRRILEHCGFWHDPAPRPPPAPSAQPRAGGPAPADETGLTFEPDAEFREHARRECTDQQDPPELPWDP